MTQRYQRHYTLDLRCTHGHADCRVEVTCDYDLDGRIIAIEADCDEPQDEANLAKQVSDYEPPDRGEDGHTPQQNTQSYESAMRDAGRWRGI